MQIKMTYPPDEVARKARPSKSNRYNPMVFGIALTVFVVIIAGLLVVTNLQQQVQNGSGRVTPTVSATPTPTPAPTIDPKMTLDEPTVTEGGHFFEKLPVIGGQQAYIAYPKEILRDSPPTLVVYSHGSITTVTTNFNDQFMKDMRAYGEFFTEHGYAFAASAEHGMNNWGSQAAADDITNLIKWVADKYPLSTKVNLIAHSMGGLVTIKFAIQNPDKVSKVALLAPTSYPTTYKKADFDKLATVDIKIWHGDKDVNVPLSLSNQLVAAAKKNGKTIDLVVLKGKTHWDVDTELKPEVLKFYDIVPATNITPTPTN